MFDRKRPNLRFRFSLGVAVCFPRAPFGLLTTVIFVVAFAGSSVAAPAPDLARFELANRAYEKGEFAEAREIYESLLRPPFSSNLFYNLANTCVRMGEAGPAMLNYERALALNPRHAEAQTNLALLRSRTGAQTESRSLLDYLVLPLSPDTLSIAAAVAGWCLLFSVAIWVTAKRKPAPIAAVAIVAGLALGYAVMALGYEQQATARAVITAKQAAARFAPADNAALAETLPAGSRIRILAERGPWVYCVLPGKRRAWLAAPSLERISIRPS